MYKPLISSKLSLNTYKINLDKVATTFEIYSVSLDKYMSKVII